MSETAVTGDGATAPRSTPLQDSWVQRVLGLAVAGGRSAGTSDAAARIPAGIVVLQQSRLAWDGLRKSVQTQLQSIEQATIKAVEAHNADETVEDEYDPAEVATGLKAIYGILQKLDTRLIEKLDAALGAEGDTRARLNREARDIVGEYGAVLASDPMLAKIDLNGFANTSIRDAAQNTLAALAQRL